MNKEEIFNILYDKDKVEAYEKFKNIEDNIDKSNELYQHFDEIKKMLLNEKSSIRVRAFRIICKLSKWDNDKKIDSNIIILLKELDDDKPTAVRQCLKVLNILLQYKPELFDVVKNKLRKVDYNKYKDSMSSLIKKDIENLLSI